MMKSFLNPIICAVFVMGCINEGAMMKAESPSLLQRIRDLLGIAKPLAAGGSRGNGQSICLLSPWIYGSEGPVAIADSRPKIHTSGSLNEIRIERNGKTEWRSLASSSQPIQTPLNWPTEAIKSGDQITVILRGRQASAGDLVRITLIGATNNKMKEYQEALQELHEDPELLQGLIKEALDRQDPALAIALLEHSPKSKNTKHFKELLDTNPCQSKTRHQTRF